MEIFLLPIKKMQSNKVGNGMWHATSSLRNSCIFANKMSLPLNVFVLYQLNSVTSYC